MPELCLQTRKLLRHVLAMQRRAPNSFSDCRVEAFNDAEDIHSTGAAQAGSATTRHSRTTRIHAMQCSVDLREWRNGPTPIARSMFISAPRCHLGVRPTSGSDLHRQGFKRHVQRVDEAARLIGQMNQSVQL